MRLTRSRQREILDAFGSALDGERLHMASLDGSQASRAEGEISFAIVHVRDDQVDDRFFRDIQVVVDCAVAKGAIVSFMFGSFVLLHSDNPSVVAAAIRSICDGTGNVRIGFGRAVAKICDYGGSKRRGYGPLFPDLGVKFAQVLRLQFGQAVELS